MLIFPSKLNGFTKLIADFDFLSKLVAVVISFLFDFDLRIGELIVHSPGLPMQTHI